MAMFSFSSPAELARDLGVRLRALRLQRNITLAELAVRAGVSTPTLAALERRGQATVATLAHVLYALGREAEMAALLAPDPPSVLEDVVAAPRPRRRARP